MPQNGRVTSTRPAPTTSADVMATTADDIHRGTLGLGQGTALYIASVLGTGILVLPGIAAAAAGPASILAVAAVLVLSIPLAGTFAALASRYPDAGGVASYVRRALGDTAARMTGYWFFFGVCVGAPVLAVLGGEYVVAVLGVDRAAVPIIGFAVFVPPFVANWFGVRVAGWVQFVLTGLLITVVVTVVAVTFPAVDASNFEPFLPNGWGGVGVAISLFVWAFAGWEVGTHIAGEFRNPRRTIPLATAIASWSSGSATWRCSSSPSPCSATGRAKARCRCSTSSRPPRPAVGPMFVAIVAAIVTLGVMNAYLPAFGKLGAALGRDGDLPRFFAKGAADGEVPRRALALTGVLVIVYFGLMLLNDLDLTGFILIHTSNMVAIYAVGHARGDAAAAPLERSAGGSPSSPRCSPPACSCSPGRTSSCRSCSPRRARHRRRGARVVGAPHPCAPSTRPPDARPRSHDPLRALTEYRAHFDAEIDFVNGGDLRARGLPPRPAVARPHRGADRRAARAPPRARARRQRDARRTSRSSRRRTAGSRGVRRCDRRMPRRHPRASGTRERARGELVDLSHAIRAGLVTYPGIPAPTITPHLTREASREHYAPGTEFAIDLITMAGNTGTYLDSPFHRYADGGDLASLALETLVDVPAEVFRLTDAAGRGIPAEVFFDRELAGTAVLLHTGLEPALRRGPSTRMARRSSPRRGRSISSTRASRSSASTRSTSTTPSRAASGRRTRSCSPRAFTSSSTSRRSTGCRCGGRGSPRCRRASRGSARSRCARSPSCPSR